MGRLHLNRQAPVRKVRTDGGDLTGQGDKGSDGIRVHWSVGHRLRERVGLRPHGPRRRDCRGAMAKMPSLGQVWTLFSYTESTEDAIQ